MRKEIPKIFKNMMGGHGVSYKAVKNKTKITNTHINVHSYAVRVTNCHSERKKKTTLLDRIVCKYTYKYLCQSECNINKDRKLMAFKQITVNRANKKTQ